MEGMFGKEKILQACKPDSVFRFAAECYHLSAMAVASHLYLPTLDREPPKR